MKTTLFATLAAISLFAVGATFTSMNPAAHSGVGRMLNISSALIRRGVLFDTQQAAATASVGSFGMFDVHFLLLFLGVAQAWPSGLRGQRMETAGSLRQPPPTDNRTLINLSIFIFSTDVNLKHLR